MASAPLLLLYLPVLPSTRDRYLAFWQSPIRYHGNIWEINPLLRTVNAYATALELAYLAHPWWKPMPMSSYALSLRLLDTSGYWDADVIADEWHMFIKAYFARNGEVQLVRVFLPFLAQATGGDTLMDAIKNRYLQTLRHAWSKRSVSWSLKCWNTRKWTCAQQSDVPFRISHDILMAGAGWVIITVGAQLPLLLNPGLLSEIASEGFRNPLFALLQVGFILVLVLGIAFWYQDVIVSSTSRTLPADDEGALSDAARLSAAAYPHADFCGNSHDLGANPLVDRHAAPIPRDEEDLTRPKPSL